MVNSILELTLVVIGLVPVAYMITNACLSRRRARVDRVPESPGSDLTVVVPVFAEDPARFSAALGSLAAQGSRVIVVGDGCDEPYRSIAEKAGAEFVALPERGGKKRAMAAGLALVTTPFVLFVDSDTVLAAGSAAHLSTYFAPGVGGVGANLHHEESDRISTGCAEFVERAREVVLRAMSSRGNVLYLDGACMMFRTELVREFIASEEFQRLTVFGRPTPLGDDWMLTDFVLSRGYRTVKAYDVAAVTQAPPTMAGFARQNVRWMRSSWIRLGRYLRGAGPSEPGWFYRLELLGTYALPLVTFALVLLRIPALLKHLQQVSANVYLTVTRGIDLTHWTSGLAATGHLLLPAQTAIGILGTCVFVGAVADRLPRHRRLRILACGLLGSAVLLLTAVYGLATVWRASVWRDGGSPPTSATGGSPSGGGAWTASSGPYLRH